MPKKLMSNDLRATLPLLSPHPYPWVVINDWQFDICDQNVSFHANEN